jgi:hypothetical protein
MTQSQNNKDVTVNDHLKAVEKGRGYLAKSVAGGAGTTTLTPDEARYGVLELTGALTGNRTIRVPSGFDHSLVVINNTTGAFTVDLDFNGGTAVRIPRGCAVPVRKNSTAAAYDYRAGMVKLPEAIAYRNTSGQVVTNNAETVIQFNAKDRDTSESFDSSTNWRFTAPAAGLYQINTMVEVDVTGSPAGNYNGHVAIRSNGTVRRRGEQSNTGTQAASTTCRHGCQALLQLAQGDTVDVVFSNGHSGGTLTVDFGIEKTYIEIICLRLGT